GRSRGRHAPLGRAGLFSFSRLGRTAPGAARRRARLGRDGGAPCGIAGVRAGAQDRGVREVPRARRVSLAEGPGTRNSSPGAVPRTMPRRFANRIVMAVPARHNPKLARILERVHADDELYALWNASNVNAIDRLGMTD